MEDRLEGQARAADAQEMLGEEQMRGAADGEVLCQSLDDAQDDEIEPDRAPASAGSKWWIIVMTCALSPIVRLFGASVNAGAVWLQCAGAKPAWARGPASAKLP